LFFNCPRDLAKGRVLGRQEGRAGDTNDMFEKRFKEYINLNPEILDYYGRDRGKLLEVDTSRDSDTSYGNLLRLLQTRREWLMLLAEDTYQP
jgi:UMP-CMP kinase